MGIVMAWTMIFIAISVESTIEERGKNLESQ